MSPLEFKYRYLIRSIFTIFASFETDKGLYKVPVPILIPNKDWFLLSLVPNKTAITSTSGK